uniref:AAA+ ATPase domain-containing protein n=1 Tax=viral metagenome TaxID=1070528 RepID=A0A6C0E7T7_9ZZZZ
MKKNLHLICLLFFSQIHFLIGFKNIIKHSISNLGPQNGPNTRSIFMSNDNVEFIVKYKYYFKKDNYNNIINDIIDHKVSKIYLDKKMNEIITLDNELDSDIEKDIVSNSNYDYNYNYDHYHIASVNPVVIPNIIEKSSETRTPIIVSDLRPGFIVNTENGFNFISNSVSFIIPFLLISSIFSFIRRSINSNNMMNGPGFKPTVQPGPGQRNSGFLNSFMPSMNQNKGGDLLQKSNITLKNWAGSPEVIEECKEVISYIENKELFNKMGAEMPKGILLEGPPGTGKTLLAKAIAGETNSTFIAISGSEFVELFVGMGASRVRDLFQNARNNNPCIIFIDEIDAVARQRGAGINMANDEREQTLNQLLYEMDGFNSNENIVVIAATNRRDVLDQAILRPGRFDRIIRVSLPDKDSREKIIEYYLNNKNIERNFDISSIADLTEGFSGAQIKNLINEAIILSARNKYTKLQEEYIFESFEKSVVGLIRKNATVDIVTQKRVAIHESGHSILTLLFNDTFDFKKASIQPTYNGAGGYTFFSEKPEIRNGGLYTKDMLKKRLIVSMGGKAAESLFYGNEYISLGAVEDLRQANKLAKRMIGNFGMGDELEVFFNEDVSDDSNPFLGRSLSIGDKYSEHTKFMMDKESLELVKNAYYTAFDLLEKNYDKLIHFSDLLLNNTVIYRDNVDLF